MWIDAFNFTLGMATEILKSPFWLPLLLLLALTIWCILSKFDSDAEGMSSLIFLILIIPIFLFFSCFFIVATKGTILLPLVFWLAIINDR